LTFPGGLNKAGDVESPQLRPHGDPAAGVFCLPTTGSFDDAVTVDITGMDERKSTRGAPVVDIHIFITA
jgi:hypothetical protein